MGSGIRFLIVCFLIVVMNIDVAGRVVVVCVI